MHTTEAPQAPISVSAWLIRCTQRPKWQMKAGATAPKKSPTDGCNHLAGENMNPAIVFYEASEREGFLALEAHAKAMGRTLTRTSRGYFLQHGQSSMHVSDVHSIKEVLKLIQANSGRSP